MKRLLLVLNQMAAYSKNLKVQVMQEDITKLKDVDAIVNAANSKLMKGGGVCGAIFKAAGSGLEGECKKALLQSHGELKTSQVAVTSSGQLRKSGIKHIIHAVGPIYDLSQNPNKELADCIENILKLTFLELKLSSVAIPAISSGIYGFPKKLCAKVFKQTIENFEQKHKFDGPHQFQVLLVNFDKETFEIFHDEFRI